MIFANFKLETSATLINTSSTIYGWALNNIFAILAVIIVVLAMRAVWNVINTLSEEQKSYLYKEHGFSTDVPKPQGFAFPKLKSINDALWKLVPLEKESDIDLGHEFDGIRELDNRLPPWWVYMFYGTIVFAVVYMYLYVFSDKGVRQAEEYEYAMEMASEQKLAFLSQQANGIDENSVVVLGDASAIAEGKSIFKTNCAACHGQLGEGGVGPNFADNYWIHGGSINNIFTTIKYGVPEKGMISWQSQLSPSAMQKVSSFILTLQGTDPPNQKEKQGDLYDPDKQ